MTAEQLTLDLPHRPALGIDDFLVSPCNETAITKIDDPEGWSSPALIIVGEEGCGKTHLTRVFQLMHDATPFTPDDTSTSDVSDLPATPAFLIDDAAPWIGNREREETLFHLYNRCFESGERMMLTARTFPAQWPFVIADLASRLKSAAIAEIGPPDDALLMAMLAKLFADRQVRVAPGVIEYVMPRIERSFASVQAFVAAVDERALRDKRQITVPLARQVLTTAAS